jgi:hypothetical protein
VTQRLEAQYRKTEYRVQAGARWLCFHVGCYDVQAEASLVQAAGEYGSWAIVTPCNPRSAALCAHENAARLENFQRCLNGLGYRWLPSLNRDPAGSWPDEPGALVLDIVRAEAKALGRQFEQSAIVICLTGQAPQLAWLPKTRTRRDRQVQRRSGAGVDFHAWLCLQPSGSSSGDTG